MTAAAACALLACSQCGNSTTHSHNVAEWMGVHAAGKGEASQGRAEEVMLAPLPTHSDDLNALG